MMVGRINIIHLRHHLAIWRNELLSPVKGTALGLQDVETST